jgi:ketosteroid isomerase-like protein
MQQDHHNVSLIHAFFEAYVTYNLDAVKSILSPDIEWHIPGTHPLSGVKSGHEDVLEYLKRVSAFGFKAKPIVMGVNDDYVIDCHLNWGTGNDGASIEFMSCLLWQIENGKITRVYNFPQDQHLVDNFFKRNTK